jgi:hypothetical protein
MTLSQEPFQFQPGDADFGRGPQAFADETAVHITLHDQVLLTAASEFDFLTQPPQWLSTLTQATLQTLSIR